MIIHKQFIVIYCWMLIWLKFRDLILIFNSHVTDTFFGKHEWKRPKFKIPRIGVNVKVVMNCSSPAPLNHTERLLLKIDKYECMYIPPVDDWIDVDFAIPPGWRDSYTVTLPIPQIGRGWPNAKTSTCVNIRNRGVRDIQCRLSMERVMNFWF